MAITITTQEKLDKERQNYFYDGMNKILADKFCVIYNGGLTIYKGETNYTAALHLNNVDSPMLIAGDFLKDGDFLDYLSKEMVNRKLFNVQYDRLNRVHD